MPMSTWHIPISCISSHHSQSNQDQLALEMENRWTIRQWTRTEYHTSTAAEMQCPEQGNIILWWSGWDFQPLWWCHEETCEQKWSVATKKQTQRRCYFRWCIWAGNCEGFSGDWLSVTKEEDSGIGWSLLFIYYLETEADPTCFERSSSHDSNDK